MKADLIAITTVSDPTLADYAPKLAEEVGVSYADLLSEFAGRSCYQSFSRPRASTASNDAYLANIIAQQHFSVLEHASATFYVTGVSRYLTHELIRHRHLSYSQLSTRYVDESNVEIVRHPTMTDDEWKELLELHTKAIQTYQILVNKMEARGLKRKAAREAARFALPGGIETRIVVSGNLRAWRDFFFKRWHVAADVEIRKFAGLILEELRSIAPNSLQDIPKEPYGTDEG